MPSLVRWTLLLCVAGTSPRPLTPRATAAATRPATVLRNVRVFDGARVLPATDVVLQGGRVAAVGPRLPEPAGASVVDGRGRTLLPGLIDVSVTRPSPGDLRRAVVLGVTTVVALDPGGPQARAQCERAAGGADASRPLSCADVVVADGETSAPTARDPHPAAAGAMAWSGPDPAAEHRGFVSVKLPASAADSAGQVPDLQGVTARAHRAGRLVIAQVPSQWAARVAATAGVDGLASVSTDAFPDSDFAGRVARRVSFVASGLSRLTGADDLPAAADLAVDSNVRPFLRITDSVALRRPGAPPDAPGRPYAAAEQTIRELRRAGVPILAASGSGDLGLVYGASLHGELALLVAAGLTPAEALASATAVAANALGMTDRGRVRAGYRADLVLVDGDPVRDIRATRAIVEVWKDGVPVGRDVDRAAVAAEKRTFRDALDQAPPRLPADGMVSAFDGGDLHASFGSGWVPSTDELVGGHSQVRLTAVAPGRGGRGGALRISGVVAEGAIRWAGALFLAGAYPGGMANLSGKSELVFWARGDGRTCQVVLYSKSRGSAAPTVLFTPGPKWARYRFPFARFDGIDGRDLQNALVSAGDALGPFAFEIDDVGIE